jgi:DNA-binding MarR family transcriptional regulator
MNIDELEIDIKRHKDKSPNTYHDVINVTIPFYMLYNKLISSITKLQEEKFSITNSELDVLGSLKMSVEKDFTLSPTKLYERLLFSSGGMTKVLKKLEDKKFIIRIDNPIDKRSKLVKMTKKGNDIFDIALKEVILKENEIFKNLDKNERDLFKNLLVKTLKD